MKLSFFFVNFFCIAYALIVHDEVSVWKRNDLVPRIGPVRGQRTGGTKEDPYVPGDGHPSMSKLGDASRTKLESYRRQLDDEPDMPNKVTVMTHAQQSKSRQARYMTRIVRDSPDAKGDLYTDIVYWNDMKHHASHIEFFETCFPSMKGRGWDQLEDDNPRQRGAKTADQKRREQRDAALGSLPSDPDFDRDEKLFARFDQTGAPRATVAYVPDYESHYEGQLVDMAIRIQNSDGNPIRIIDGRTGDAKEFNCMILKGPKNQNARKWGDPHWVDVQNSDDWIPLLREGKPKGSARAKDYELWSPTQVWRKLQRRGLDQRLRSRQVGIITTGEQQANNGTQTTESQQATYEEYMWAFDQIQNAAAGVVFPILDEMLNNTNVGAVYDAAWSIYSSLVLPGVSMIGPFKTSSSNIGSFEDTLGFTNEAQILTQYANDAVLMGQYQYYWEQCVNALNSTSIDNSSTTILSDIMTFSSALVTNDTSVVPEIMMEVDTSLEWSYFTIYNETYPLSPPTTNYSGNTSTTSQFWTNLTDTLAFTNLTGNATHGWTNLTDELVAMLNMSSSNSSSMAKRHQPVKLYH